MYGSVWTCTSLGDVTATAMQVKTAPRRVSSRHVAHTWAGRQLPGTAVTQHHGVASRLSTGRKRLAAVQPREQSGGMCLSGCVIVRPFTVGADVINRGSRRTAMLLEIIHDLGSWKVIRPRSAEMGHIYWAHSMGP